MNANELLTILQGECKNHGDCTGCTFESQKDCVRECKITELTGGLNPLNVKFSEEYPKENGITINVKNVYVCERKNDG